MHSTLHCKLAGLNFRHQVRADDKASKRRRTCTASQHCANNERYCLSEHAGFHHRVELLMPVGSMSHPAAGTPSCKVALGAKPSPAFLYLSPHWPAIAARHLAEINASSHQPPPIKCLVLVSTAEFGMLKVVQSSIEQSLSLSMQRQLHTGTIGCTL